jgi:hypothetical protein
VYGTGFSSPSATITPLANGWYRCTVTATTTSGLSLWVNLYLDNGSGTGAQSTNYTGDGASLISLWGVQIEVNAFATSYIPTTTTSVARAQDSVTGTGVLLSTIDAAVGSVFARFQYFLNQNNNSDVIAGGGNRQILGCDSTPGTMIGTYNGSVDLHTNLGSGDMRYQSVTGAVGWDASGRSIVGMRGTVATDTGTIGASTGVVKIGSYSTDTTCMDGYIQRLVAWSTRLSDAKLQSLT